MIETILLLTLVVALAIFLVFTSIINTRLSKKAILLGTAICSALILTLLLYTGTGKVKSDISRLIRNSFPKDAKTVYSVLFGKPVDECVRVINFKDQVIPKVDCCIWMELRLCPAEIKRIISSKNYITTRFSTTGSLNFLTSFTDKPKWWTPQLLGDSLIKYTIKFNADKEQTLFVSPDSTHSFICDRAQ